MKLLVPRPQTQRTKVQFQRDQQGLEVNCDAKSTDFGPQQINRTDPAVVL
jgi:hypothetical protein